MLIKLTGIAVLLSSTLLVAQDRDRDRDRDEHGEFERTATTVLPPGTLIPVRVNETVDVERSDNRIYTGMVEQDVRGDNGRLAIPRGSTVELIVRVEPDNELILDLDSVVVNGRRYAVRTDQKRFEPSMDGSLIGSIVGAIEGGQVRGRAVRVARDTLVTFRLERPMEMGVVDRGLIRDGHHYHDEDRDR